MSPEQPKNQGKFLLPSCSQWKQIFKVFSKSEKKAVVFFFVLALLSSCFLVSNFYVKNTEIAPDFGGIHIEGVKGQPRFINPIYAGSNDVDRDLIGLLFSGLMKYDKDGNIIPDLAKSYQIKEEGKIYEFILKEGIVWSDKQKFTTDDIIFTIKTIQNPDYKSSLRANWLGVEIEKISDKAIRFNLKKPYAGFLERLTLKILPVHIWQDVSPENFFLSPYNLQPVSCGPYVLEELAQKEKSEIVKVIESLTLEADPNYFGSKPHLAKITFLFFENEEEIIQAAKQKEITGFSLFSSKDYSQINKNFSDYSFILPRYFAVFFNSEESKILGVQEIRQALNYGTDKKEIIEKIFSGKAKAVNSPVLPEIYGYTSPSDIFEYDLEKAKELFEKAGYEEAEGGVREKVVKKKPSFQFKKRLEVGSRGEEVEELQKCLANPPAGGPEIYPEKEITGYFGKKTKAAVIKFQEKYREDVLDPYSLKNGTGIVGKSTRKKLNEMCFETEPEILCLKFSLITAEDSVLKEVAETIKEQWRKIGVDLEIQTAPISQLQYDFIKPRNYEMLLFGEVLGITPDPYPFWHSLQKKDPGLNLSLYENKESDKLLEEAREFLNDGARKEKYEEFQDILIEEAPCVFLYSPDYLYFVSPEIKGIEPGLIVDPSQRFSDIGNWYIETKRKWK